MYTEYPDGFTEALIRNLTDGRWEVATLELSFDPWSPDVPEWLRLECPSPHRVTVAARADRGVLLLKDLHVPLAAEISWALQRLDDLETLLRQRLPAEHRDSQALRSAVVLYADRNFDMVPDEPRLDLVDDEGRPDSVLDRLTDRLFDTADPDEVYALFESMRQLGAWRSREDWVDALVTFDETVPAYRLAS